VKRPAPRPFSRMCPLGCPEMSSLVFFPLQESGILNEDRSCGSVRYLFLLAVPGPSLVILTRVKFPRFFFPPYSDARAENWAPEPNFSSHFFLCMRFSSRTRVPLILAVPFSLFPFQSWNRWRFLLSFDSRSFGFMIFSSRTP